MVERQNICVFEQSPYLLGRAEWDSEIYTKKRILSGVSLSHNEKNTFEMKYVFNQQEKMFSRTTFRVLQEIR